MVGAGRRAGWSACRSRSTCPDGTELTAERHVVRVPLTVPFRGVSAREAVLLRGPAGWAEFAPFVEYGDAESARWLAAAIEAAWAGWPAPLAGWCR